jgi:cephalosporin hydroxylase
MVHHAGLKAIVADPLLSQHDWRKLDPAAARRNVAKAIRKVGNHPAVFGYYIKDEPCADEFDGLFIDSFHTFSHALEELRVHGKRAKKWITLHDTWLYGLRGEDGTSPGLEEAIAEFVKGNPEWQVSEVSPENNGLTILRRQ